MLKFIINRNFSIVLSSLALGIFLVLPIKSSAQAVAQMGADQLQGQSMQADDDGKPKKTKIIYEDKKNKQKRHSHKKRAQEQANMYLPDDASAPANPEAIPDYIEPVNRAIYKFNNVFDRYLLRPVAVAYRDTIPQRGRDMVGNFLQNLASPITFANSILQGDVDNSFTTFWRFVFNSTIGLGGLFDPAEDYLGLNYKKEDFGLTLAHYGVGHGTYLVLPILGPSSLRDGVGLAADLFADPVTYTDNVVMYSTDAVRIIHGRSEALSITDTINQVSLDPYATIRSGYAQRRNDLAHR